MGTVFYTASGVTGDVDAYRVDAGGGSLERAGRVSAGGNLSSMAVSAGGRFLYVADRTEPGVVTFGIEGDGGLSRVGGVATRSPLVNLCAAGDGGTVYGVSYVDGTVWALPVGGDGVVAAAEAAPLELGGDARCHDVVEIAPGEVIVSALGHDALYRVRRDPDSGALRQAPPSVTCEKNAGPRHMRLSPARDVLYVLGERNARITAYPLESGGAARSWPTVPPPIALAPGIVRAPGSSAPAADPGSGLPYTWAADLAVSPDGRLLFSSERSSSTVSVTVAATGELLAWAPAERQPRGIGLDPEGRFLLVTGEGSDTVSLLEVTGGGRGLRLAARAPASPGVLWVQPVIPNG